MAVQKINNALLFCLAADTKPTTYPTNTLCYVQDTGDLFRWSGAAWILLQGATKTETLTGKTLVAASNTITDTSAAQGDVLVHNGTRFVRLGKGTTNQVLTSGASTLSWSSFNAETTGTATGSGDGSTVIFNIAHSLGSTPYCAFVQCSSHTNVFTFTYTSTNIVVTFTTAPGTGTNNVIFQWKALA